MAIVQDPVCGMDVDDENAPASTDFQGTTFYFCSESCYEQFTADPNGILFPP